MISTYLKICERWFTGKALENFRTYVTPTLVEAEQLGYWPKGASRKVHAALNKQAVAAKFAKANERSHNGMTVGEIALRNNQSGLLVDIRDDRTRLYGNKLRGSDFVHAMMFGQVMHAPGLYDLGVKLKPLCVDDDERAALHRAHEWAANWAPVAKLLKTLDMRRPKPTIVCKTLSPTVLGNVGRAMNVDLTSIESPPTRGKWVKRMMPIKGRLEEVEVLEIEILWPEGTRHNVSRFASGTAHNDQCHACGHAIKNPYNWVPLLAQTGAGPVSLWVGRDCAKKLFECDVTGDAEYKR